MWQGGVGHARGIRWLDELFQDIRYGLRVLRKSPGFTTAAGQGHRPGADRRVCLHSIPHERPAGLSATDPVAFGAVTLALLVAGLGASYWPVRRAMKLDPISVLRCE